MRARPQTAMFSAKEYEEAKRRVKRLDAAASGGSATLASNVKSAGGDDAGRKPRGEKAMPSARAGKADGDFVATLQRNIAELRECIIGRLSPYPQLQVSFMWRASVKAATRGTVTAGSTKRA
jgi:hypothetical protein